MEIGRYSFPTEIRFGPRVREVLPEVLEHAGVRRPLLVTDRGLADLPIVEEVAALCGPHVLVFSGVWGNPVESQVVAGVHTFNAHQADGIVAVGGGASMDVAKVIGLMIHHPGDLFDYAVGSPAARPVNKALPYLVALPTTAGSGSEVGRAAVISDDETRAKKIIFSPWLLPEVVLADPELALGLSPKLTASTGFDALTHLIEAYLATGFHPICDGIALEGLRLAARSIGRCVQHARLPGDRADHVEARGYMQNAAMMGAIAFQKGLGVTHACAHALSTVFDAHHGTANGVMLPYCMAYNAPVVPDRLADLAVAVGAEAATPAGFIDWIVALRRELGIPAHLDALGLDARDHLDRLVAVAYADPCHRDNPRPVTKHDFHELFSAAMSH